MNKTKPLPSRSLHSSVCSGVGRRPIKKYIHIVINAMKRKRKDKEIKGLRVDGAILNSLIGEIFSQKLSF